MNTHHPRLQKSIGNLIGRRIFLTASAADMREFGFECPSDRKERRTAQENDWFLHISGSWRLETNERIITGSFDWSVPDNADRDRDESWDPAHGGSLQEAKLREVFRDDYVSNGFVSNYTDLFTVEAVDVDRFGGLTVDLSGGYRLRVFPTGSSGEFWRVFQKGNLDSHAVCEGKWR